MNTRLVSWNILQGGGRRINDIAAALLELEPDILTIQEYRYGKSTPTLLDCFDKLGLHHQHHADPASKKNAVMVASRYPLNPKTLDNELNPALTVSVEIETESQLFNVIAAHLPHKKEQLPYFNALLDLDADDVTPTLIIGDLNCGIPFEDSDTRTFSNTHLFQELLKNGWIDSWRHRHAKDRQFTWISPRGNGYRYDHCLSTESLDHSIVSIEYNHNLRESGISDHSAIVLDCKFE